MADWNMKEAMRHQYHKMHVNRNILFKAFLINYIAIFITWLLSMVPGFNGLIVHFTHMAAGDVNMYMLDMLGMWKILGVVLFLMPALAIWWEMHSFKKREM